jgi:stage II sporulation protein D
LLPQPLENRIVLLIIIAVCVLLLIPVIIASTLQSCTPVQQPEQNENDSSIDLKTGKLSTINVFVAEDNKVETMDMEEYILCVVSAEMPASYEIEALKAQACAARTFAVSRMENGGCSRAKNADICTDSGHCQAYNSPEEMKKHWGGEYLTKYNKIKKAVEETKGQIIVYNDKPISALYHSTSGGYTEDSENVFSSSLPYLRSVKSDGEEPYASRFHGEVTVPYSDFAAKMHKFNARINIGETKAANAITDIDRSSTGRVLKLKVDGQTLTGRELRGIFNLNSTNFKVNYKEGKVVFDTIGFGHGVGMSQTGANAMAKQGSNYKQILTHYYTGVSIKTAYQ